MRLRHPDGQTVHLAVAVAGHTVRKMPKLLQLIDSVATPQRRRLGVDVLSISLHLSPQLAALLASSLGMRRRLKQDLDQRGLAVVTVDAGPVVTPPDGTWRGWLSYTLDLARIAVDLMPEDSVHGSVSTTLPRRGDGPEEHEIALRQLDDLGGGLIEIAWHTGQVARVAFEPAPDTLITTIDDAARLLDRVDPARIGVCLDPRQLVRAGETPARALAQLRRQRLGVVKLRLGSALQDPAVRPTALGAMQALLGGAKAECDHLEVTTPAEFDAAREELDALGLEGAADPRMPGSVFHAA